MAGVSHRRNCLLQAFQSHLVVPFTVTRPVAIREMSIAVESNDPGLEPTRQAGLRRRVGLEADCRAVLGSGQPVLKRIRKYQIGTGSYCS